MTNLTQTNETTNSKDILYVVEYLGDSENKHKFGFFSSDHSFQKLLTTEELFEVYMKAHIIDDYSGEIAMIDQTYSDCFDPNNGHYETSNPSLHLDVYELMVMYDTNKISSKHFFSK